MSSSPALRWAAPPIALMLCFVWGWTGWHSYEAAKWMAVVQVRAQHDPVNALIANANAIEMFPYDGIIRRQYSASLMQAITVHREKLQIHPQVLEDVWRWGQTVSPWDTTVLIARAMVLIHYGPLVHLGGVVDRLVKVAPAIPNTWVAASIWWLANGDVERGRQAAARGLALKWHPAWGPEMKAQLEALKGAHVNEE